MVITLLALAFFLGLIADPGKWYWAMMTVLGLAGIITQTIFRNRKDK